MMDAIAPLAGNIPAWAPVVAGYVDGLAVNVWGPATFARFPNAVHIGIATSPASNAGHVLDIERGDATPTDAPRWIAQRLGAGLQRATLYVNRSNWPAARAAVEAAGLEAHVDYWVADPLERDGAWVQHVVPGSIGTQWAYWQDPAGNPLFDQSEMLASWWPLAGLELEEEQQSMLATDPQSGGIWTLDTDGTVWASGGAPYLGGVPDGALRPDGTHAGPVPIVGAIVGLASRLMAGGWGYVIVTRVGSPIGENTVGAAAGDIHRYYEFPRPT